MAKKKKATASEIEALYDSGQYRLTQERNDFLLPQIKDFVREKKWLNLRPEYQRRLVWDRKKKSLFIESLLMNVPIPPVFLYEIDLSRYEVMDGQQRLNAVLEFYENQFTLTGLEAWSVLNGLDFSKCPPRIKRGLDRRRISATVLLAESAKDDQERDLIRRHVFERLNTGGETLNAQELRNSLYGGPFNELIIELAGTRLFNEIWGVPPYDDHYRRSEGFISPELADNKLFKRMLDCEIVLRYLAFRRSSKIKGAARKILDTCMRDNMSADGNVIGELRSGFLTNLETAHSIFRARTFQVKDPKGKWRHSQPLFDAVMVALDRLKDDHSKLIKSRTKITKKLETALQDEDTYELVVGKPNTAAAIKARIDLVTQWMKKVA